MNPSLTMAGFSRLLVVTAAILLNLPAFASAQIYKISGTSTGISPKISGNYVAWRGDTEATYGIYLYDGSAVSQIAQPVAGLPYLDTVASIDGNKVAWSALSGPGESREVFYYDGSTAMRLTDNNYADQAARVSGNNVVWSSLTPPAETAIHMYDGLSTQRLTDVGERGWSPDVDGHNIVWEGDSGIVRYDGTTTATLPDSVHGGDPKISGDNVVWQWGDGDNAYVSYYDGTTTTVIGTHPHAAYTSGVTQTEVSSSIIAWLGYDGHDYEVFYSDGVQTIQLTDNAVDERYLAVSDEGAVWVGPNLTAFDLSTGRTIDIYGGCRGTPDIRGRTVVWANFDSEILMTTIPEPTAISLVALGALALLKRQQ